MDYILYGAGTGASLAVIGWVLREWGPQLRDGRPEEGQIQSASELIDRMSWSRFCASCGMALVFGGTLILLVTGAVALWNPGDDLAARILLGTYIAVSILLLLWSGFYTRQFGTHGIYRPAPPEPIVQVAEVDTALSTAQVTRAETPDEGEVAPGHTEVVADLGDDGTERDIETVAASRGGMGRFAAFFNRAKPTAEPADATLELLDEEIDANGETVDQGVEVITDNAGDVAVEDEIVVNEVEESLYLSTDDQTDTVVVEDDFASEPAEASTEPTPSSDPQSEPAYQTGNGEATDIGETPEETASPEADALTELRRRRLARLSGDDQS